jgi:Tfp pilus assembly protein PilP
MLNDKRRSILFIFMFAFAFVVIVYYYLHRDTTWDLKNYINQKRAIYLKTVSTIASKEPTIVVPKSVVYHAESLRPPFGERPSPDQLLTTARVIGTNPLIAYSISVLKFVGTLKQKGVLYAFILAPDGVIYQVKVGDEIDLQHGKVVSIQERELVVQDQPSAGNARSGGRLVTLQLKGGN